MARRERKAAITMKSEIFQDVLDSYVEAAGRPSWTALNEWIRRYPQFRQELIDFTVNWSLMENLPPSKEAEEPDEETLVLRGMSIVEDRLHALGLRKHLTEKEFSDLLAEARASGLNAHGLAKRCNITTGIITKLARHFIDFNSIPESLIESISSILGKHSDIVKKYLRGPMIMAPNARYHAKTPPKLPSKTQNFFDVVRMDRAMDKEQRAFWLGYEEKPR